MTGTKLLVRREAVSDGGFGSLEKRVEVTNEAVEGREARKPRTSTSPESSELWECGRVSCIIPQQSKT
jgi:hypothetical protein